jgi:hypothetical protein
VVHVTLTPAYGRDYKSKAAVEADIRAGKDFVFNAYGDPGDGRYCNLQDLQGKYKSVNVRYAKLTKVAVITL